VIEREKAEIGMLIDATFKKAPKSRKTPEVQTPPAGAEIEDEGPF
jgi:hypothetical protein